MLQDKKALTDLGERCVMTFAQSFLAIVMAGPMVGMDADILKAFLFSENLFHTSCASGEFAIPYVQNPRRQVAIPSNRWLLSRRTYTSTPSKHRCNKDPRRHSARRLHGRVVRSGSNCDRDLLFD